MIPDFHEEVPMARLRGPWVVAGGLLLGLGCMVPPGPRPREPGEADYRHGPGERVHQDRHHDGHHDGHGDGRSDWSSSARGGMGSGGSGGGGGGPGGR